MIKDSLRKQCHDTYFWDILTHRHWSIPSEDGILVPLTLPNHSLGPLTDSKRPGSFQGCTDWLWHRLSIGRGAWMVDTWCFLMFRCVYESPGGLLVTPIFKIYISSIGWSEWFHPMVAGWRVVNLEFGWSFLLIECLDNIASPSFSSVSSLLVWECQQKPKLGLFGEVFPGKKGVFVPPNYQNIVKFRRSFQQRQRLTCKPLTETLTGDGDQYGGGRSHNVWLHFGRWCPETPEGTPSLTLWIFRWNSCPTKLHCQLPPCSFPVFFG